MAETRSAFALNDAGMAQFRRLVERYPTKQSALMPALWLIQDQEGHVPPEAVDWLVEQLDVSAARVHELLSFYTMFRAEPQAEYVLQVCHNISCHLSGARPLLEHLKQRLGIGIGETTPDGKFALEGVECLAACGMGPAMQLGKHFYEKLTPARVDEILESLRRGVVPRADTDRELAE
ncbi:MAG: NAD(P)H-dependent oxidoreductase subunit E [Gemmatimonadetes bacterium]|nr:NAD(P)H-dependent oxidoreductase subunit E [Gemmatimonadota bacterium]